MENFEKLDENKRNRIINSAMKEFALNGYSKASTVNIARDADIAKGALFYYFGNKNEMFRYLFLNAVEIMEDKIYGILPKERTPFIKLMRLITDAKLSMTREYPLISQFMSRAYMDEVSTEDDIKKKYEEIIARFFTYVSEYSDMSDIREDLSFTELMNIVSWISEGYAKQLMDNMSYDGRTPDESETETIKKISDECLSLIERLITKN